MPEGQGHSHSSSPVSPEMPNEPPMPEPSPGYEDTKCEEKLSEVQDTPYREQAVDVIFHQVTVPVAKPLNDIDTIDSNIPSSKSDKDKLMVKPPKPPRARTSPIKVVDESQECGSGDSNIQIQGQEIPEIASVVLEENHDATQEPVAMETSEVLLYVMHEYTVSSVSGDINNKGCFFRPVNLLEHVSLFKGTLVLFRLFFSYVP